MIILTVDEIIGLHSKLIAQTGGSEGVRDRGLLESAVYSAQSGFGNEEVYPTVEEKAARLMYSIIGNHSFIDGNKRIGVLVMLMTLKLNGISMEYTQQELTQLGLSVASGKADFNTILAFIEKHK